MGVSKIVLEDSEAAGGDWLAGKGQSGPADEADGGLAVESTPLSRGPGKTHWLKRRAARLIAVSTVRED